MLFLKKKVFEFYHNNYKIYCLIFTVEYVKTGSYAICKYNIIFNNCCARYGAICLRLHKGFVYC